MVFNVFSIEGLTLETADGVRGIKMLSVNAASDLSSNSVVGGSVFGVDCNDFEVVEGVS